MPRLLGLGCGCIVGIPIGMLLLLMISLASVQAIKIIAQTPSAQNDVTIVVQEDYLNSEASNEINGQFSTGIDALTITGLQLDMNPDNRLDMRAEFKVDVGFFNFTTSAGITNRISAQYGRIVVNMEGRPEIGNLTIPIDLLPFNLSDKITEVIDKVNNDVLASKLNDMLDANLSGTNLSLDSVTTDSDKLVLYLKQR